jgi:hypothetical protein
VFSSGGAGRRGRGLGLRPVFRGHVTTRSGSQGVWVGRASFVRGQQHLRHQLLAVAQFDGLAVTEDADVGMKMGPLRGPMVAAPGRAPR